MSDRWGVLQERRFRQSDSHPKRHFLLNKNEKSGYKPHFVLHIRGNLRVSCLSSGRQILLKFPLSADRSVAPTECYILDALKEIMPAANQSSVNFTDLVDMVLLLAVDQPHPGRTQLRSTDAKIITAGCDSTLSATELTLRKPGLMHDDTQLEPLCQVAAAVALLKSQSPAVVSCQVIAWMGCCVSPVSQRFAVGRA